MRAVAYIRVSTDDQAKEGVSLDAQRARVDAWCASQGLTLDDRDVHVDIALREAMSTLMAAAMQLSTAGSSHLRSKAAKILVETRRQLYLLLADAGTEESSVEDATPDES